MAAAVAAASAGEPQSPDELLPKGEAEKTEEKLEEDDDEELDETLSERLWGLTEMFPERKAPGHLSEEDYSDHQPIKFPENEHIIHNSSFPSSATVSGSSLKPSLEADAGALLFVQSAEQL
uniref:uncharacterized protein LOC103788005 isoform X2 n=1 Tax=Callithrix jacchus TaxID=9483 RepID=UPI0023DD56C1|nr:uncharacterized protein LOC103788005 isoform X2 [Callithrix jacchus]